MNQITVLQLTPQELKDIIKSVVLDCLKEVGFIPEDELLSSEKACELLGITRTGLWMWRKEGKLAYHRIGRRVYYKKSDINNALKRVDLSRYRK